MYNCTRILRIPVLKKLRYIHRLISTNYTILPNIKTDKNCADIFTKGSKYTLVRKTMTLKHRKNKHVTLY